MTNSKRNIGKNIKQLPLLAEMSEKDLKAREKSLMLMKKVAEKAPIKRKLEENFTPEELEVIKSDIKEEQAKAEKYRKLHSAEERERREKIIKIKKKAREMEKTNQSKIILFPSYSRNTEKEETEWYKMGGFSALYYVYRMSDRMGRMARLMKDTDKFAKMEAIASIRSIDSFINEAVKLNEIDRYEKTEDGFYIFYLKKALTDDELGILRRSEGARREMMHNVLRPKQADAAVYQQILTLDRQVLPRTSNMEKGYYVAIGDTMAKNIFEITKTYFRYANGYIDLEEVKQELLDLIEGLLAGTALLGENEVWGYDIATSIGENVNILKKSVMAMK